MTPCLHPQTFYPDDGVGGPTARGLYCKVCGAEVPQTKENETKQIDIGYGKIFTVKETGAGPT